MGDVDFMKPYLEKYIDDKIIIYTNSRKETMKIAETIDTFMQENYNEKKERKTFCMAYHAGMSKKVRESIQEKFSNNTFNIIVTTIAFGMGIDQTIRCVLILGAPSSIEEYYQQIGRAGRDGKPSEVILFYQPQKLVLQDRMILNKTKNRFSDITKNKRKNLYMLKDFFETKNCRRKFILSYFGQKPKFFCCRNCDNCCEKKLVNLTSKVYQVAITGIDMDLIYSDEDKMKLIESKLYTNKFNKMIESDELTFWKKMIRVNKFGSDKIPKKLAIMI
jgi:superfamily II DNA helicase RecQ